MFFLITKIVLKKITHYSCVLSHRNTLEIGYICCTIHANIDDRFVKSTNNAMARLVMAGGVRNNDDKAYEQYCSQNIV